MTQIQKTWPVVREIDGEKILVWLFESRYYILTWAIPIVFWKEVFYFQGKTPKDKALESGDKELASCLDSRQQYKCITREDLETAVWSSNLFSLWRESRRDQPRRRSTQLAGELERGVHCGAEYFSPLRPKNGPAVRKRPVQRWRSVWFFPLVPLWRNYFWHLFIYGFIYCFIYWASDCSRPYGGCPYDRWHHKVVDPWTLWV